MLINFSLCNFRSFRNQAELTMLATKEKQHGERLSKISGYGIRVLPVTAIFGGNASGKTNLFRALRFVQQFVVDGTKIGENIGREPFKCEHRKHVEPTEFKISILVDEPAGKKNKEKIYEYSFAINNSMVLSEKMVEITKSGENTLFDRANDYLKEELKHNGLDVVFRQTRANLLFLTNSVSMNYTQFSPIYNWFNLHLKLISPDSRFGNYELYAKADDPLGSFLGNNISRFDTGILHIGTETTGLEKTAFLQSIRDDLQKRVVPGVEAHVRDEDESYIISNHDGELAVKKIVSFHKGIDIDEVQFSFKDESDGTRRLLDLLPVFMLATIHKPGNVFIIDELDRSLHTLLTKQLLETYLESCNENNRNQVIFTTHDIMLMDQNMFRRDEMWFTEKTGDSSSCLQSFSEFSDIRYDKDVRKSYLLGRLGGVPKLRSVDVGASDEK